MKKPNFHEANKAEGPIPTIASSNCFNSNGLQPLGEGRKPTLASSQTPADSAQVEVTKTAQEAGIKFSMFLTRAVFDNCVAVPDGVTGQDEAGRLWDVA
jgi:hypothetical protein